MTPTQEVTEIYREDAAVRPSIVVPGNEGIKVVKAVSILKSREELYTFWRRFSNLSKIIKYPVAITEESETDSVWTVSGPPGHGEVSWRASIINDVPNSLIAWATAEGADVPHAGSVRFEEAPPDEGTEVTVALEYNAPGGKLGALLGKLSGKEPAQQVAETLRRFKALMEAGEIPTIEGQSVGGPQGPRKGEK